MQDPLEPSEAAPQAAGHTVMTGSSDGGSLLADLLSETSGEAQRELEQIKAQLADKRAQAEETRRVQEQERRERLDALREQEAQRREEMIRDRERKRAEAEARRRPPEPTAAVEAAAVQPQVAGPEKKRSGMIWVALAIVLVGGLAVGGWLYLEHQKAQTAAAKQAPAPQVEAAKPVEPKPGEGQPAETVAASPEKGPVAAATPAEPLPAEAAAPTPAVEPPAPEPIQVARRDAENEARRDMFRAGPVWKVSKKYRPGKRTGGGGNGKIKIKALDLGRGK